MRKFRIKGIKKINCSGESVIRYQVQIKKNILIFKNVYWGGYKTPVYCGISNFDVKTFGMAMVHFKNKEYSNKENLIKYINELKTLIDYPYLGNKILKTDGECEGKDSYYINLSNKNGVFYEGSYLLDELKDIIAQRTLKETKINYTYLND